MKIELKKIKTNLQFSKETTMFQAELWVDGIKVADCSNDGHGGNTDIRAYGKENRAVIEKCEAYFKTLPKEKFEDFEFEQNLEGYIDDLLQKHLEEKELKSSMAKGVVYEDKEGVVRIITWKKFNIAKMLEIENGRKAISDCIARLKKENCQILNTNIPANLM